MKSYAQALDLKDDPETVEKYKEYHRAVWPEVLESLRSIGISKMEIFLLGTHLFMYYEAPDDFVPERDFQAYTDANPRAEEWNDLMMTFQARVPEAGPDDWWAPMEKVFDLGR
ncbi:MAG: L-rhamnose mutarotase [Chloroflexi bacterium]|nr:L-rhamnose mutarotase [Chloroflexota bacterium]MCH8816502.1 L-rhamnose mutarotase [Chloroflexota bacterium]